MSNRHSQRKHDQHIYSLRFWLVVLLGGRCAHEHLGDCERALELDHINGRDWQPREVNSATRVKILVREAADGKLQLLCRRHNARKQ